MARETRSLIPVGILAILITPVFAQSGTGRAGTNPGKGDFYIVSSIDLAKKQILLKRPTEVTELMRVDGETRYFEEGGKPIRLTDLRAGGVHYVEAHGRTVACGRHSQRPDDPGFIARTLFERR